MRSAEQDSVARWRQLPFRWHVLAVALLMLAAVARWGVLTAPDPRGDEAVYLAAFERVQGGETPYSVTGFFYPHTFARAGAVLLDHLGAGATLAVLRAVNLAGLCLSFWLAAAWLSFALPWRWVVVAAGLCLSPAVAAGLDLGNVSFFVVGITLGALVAWPLRPLSAGALLGAGVALKPVAPGAILVLLAHRPKDGGPRHLLAAGAALALAAALVLPLSSLREMLGQEMVPLAHERSFSLHRLLGLLGLEVEMAWVALTAIALAGVAVRWRPLDPTQLMCFAIGTVSLTTPLVWNHTLIVTLPVQALALTLAWRRISKKGHAVWRRYEPALVALAVLMIHAGTAAGFDHLRPAIQVVLLLFIGLAPALLCGYVLRFMETESPGSRGRTGLPAPMKKAM